MDRPKVVVYQEASVDGRVAYTPDVSMLYVFGKWRGMMGDSTLYPELMEWIKSTHHPQAFLEGSGTFVRKDCKLDDLPLFHGDTQQLYGDFLPDSVLKDPKLQGWGVLVDSKGLCRNLLAWVDEGIHGLILVAKQTSPEYLADLQRKEYPYLVAGEERVNLPLALEKLRTQLGVTCICSAGGGKINGALLRAGLVDEINILVCPVVIGGMETPSLFDSPDLKIDDWPTKLNLISVQSYDEGHVWFRYEVIRE
ncbi:MAG TPA: deaminase [Dehalococcoidia bacterium]|nr:deaminase [Dehalococcoidia bacterium]